MGYENLNLLSKKNRRYQLQLNYSHIGINLEALIHILCS